MLSLIIAIIFSLFTLGVFLALMIIGYIIILSGNDISLIAKSPLGLDPWQSLLLLFLIFVFLIYVTILLFKRNKAGFYLALLAQLFILVFTILKAAMLGIVAEDIRNIILDLIILSLFFFARKNYT